MHDFLLGVSLRHFCRPDAHVLFDRLAPLNPVAHPTICASLSRYVPGLTFFQQHGSVVGEETETFSFGFFRAVEKAIEPIYSQVKHSYAGKSSAHANGNADAKRKCSVNISKDLCQMLSCIGPYLHRDVILLQKVTPEVQQ